MDDFTLQEHFMNIFFYTKWSFYFGWKDYPNWLFDYTWYDGLNYAIHIGFVHWEAH